MSARGATVWLTGLPAAGKTTLARALEAKLRAAGRVALVLDGDEVRKGLSADLGFDEASRRENVRRCAAVASLAASAGVTCLVALVSPHRSARDAARALHVEKGLPFLECWLAAPLEVCERRDPKGLYARARAGLAHEVTGVSSPFEPPLAAEVVVPPEWEVERAVQAVLGLLRVSG